MQLIPGRCINDETAAFHNCVVLVFVIVMWQLLAAFLNGVIFNQVDSLACGFFFLTSDSNSVAER